MSVESKALKTLLHPGTSKILSSLDEDCMTFSELMFATQLNPSVLTNLLKILCEMDVIKKRDNKYSLTDRGYTIMSLLEELLTVLANGKKEKPIIQP